MFNIFEVTDRTGRNIKLTKEQWAHIREYHFNVENPEEISETIQKPDKTAVDERENVIYFYKYFKQKSFKSKFLKVIVRYLNRHGFVISAHFVRSIVK